MKAVYGFLETFQALDLAIAVRSVIVVGGQPDWQDLQVLEKAFEKTALRHPVQLELE